jgi:hypothetical protein
MDCLRTTPLMGRVKDYNHRTLGLSSDLAALASSHYAMISI